MPWWQAATRASPSFKTMRHELRERLCGGRQGKPVGKTRRPVRGWAYPPQHNPLLWCPDRPNRELSDASAGEPALIAILRAGGWRKGPPRRPPTSPVRRGFSSNSFSRTKL